MSKLKFGNDSQGEKVAEKAYLYDMEILSAEDYSTRVNDWGYSTDLAIMFNTKTPNGESKQYVGGNFKRDDDNNEITGWGSAFTVKFLIESSGLLEGKTPEEIEALTNSFESSKIPAALLKKLAGKTVYRISYAAGLKEDDETKIHWKTYGKISFDKTSLIKLFLKDVENGYPKDYSPDVEPGDTSFNFGANAQKGSEEETW